MKSKLSILLLTVLCLSVINSCKKKEDSDSKENLDSNVQQFNDDSNRYKSESDQADNDINAQLQDVSSFGRLAHGTNILSSPLCGATIDTSQASSQKTVFFNFDGVTPCFSPSRTRSGQIKVQLTTGNHWSDVGSVLTITYIDFKVKRLSDQKSIMFNGVKTLKNINGNDWLGFLAGTSTLKYQERANNIAVTFDNNTNATWNSARMTEWSTSSGAQPSQNHWNFKSDGDTTINGVSHVDSWGVNRNGQNFTTYYTSPIISNTYCGLWRFNSGELVHWVNGKNFILTLGVDENGNHTPYDCAYGFKVAWTGANGNTQSVVLSY